MSTQSWYTNKLATEESISMSPSSPTNMPIRSHAAAIAEKKRLAEDTDAVAKEARKQVDAALTKLTDICIHAMSVYKEATDIHTKAINAKRLAQLRKDKAVLVNNVANALIPSKTKLVHILNAKKQLEASEQALSTAKKDVAAKLDLKTKAHNELVACGMQPAYTEANEKYKILHKRAEDLERIAMNALHGKSESEGGRKRKTAKPRKPTKKRASR